MVDERRYWGGADGIGSMTADLKRRIAAADRNTICTVCSRPAHDPYRRVGSNGAGIIIEGCVARIHDDHVSSPPSVSWIARARKSFRAAGLDRGWGLGGY